MTRSAGALLFLAALAAAPASAQTTESPKGYVEMPQAEDGAWVLTSPAGSNRNWGRPEFVRYLALVAREWKRRYPERPRLRLGDLSKADGSEFPPHKTHKDGLTADLFTTPQNICHIKWADQGWTLDLATLLVDFGAKQILYNGELVTTNVPVAKKWPKHDDHFHVVIDPSKVPVEGAPLVFAQPPFADEGWVPFTAVKEDLTGLELSWRVLGGSKLKGVQVVVEQFGEGVVHDSGLLKLKKPSYALPIPVLDGKTYRWKVDVETADGSKASSGWQTIKADYGKPKVTLLGPKDEVEVDGPPTLSWSYLKPSAAQQRYVIELDGDSNHRKVKHTLGPFEGASARHLLTQQKLKRTKRYFWRVVVTDAHGNEGESEWAVFKTSRLYGKAKATATRAKTGDGKPAKGRPPGNYVSINASRLNMRAGPGTTHAVKRALSMGTEVRVINESGDWLEVELWTEEGVLEDTGFVSKRYVK